MTHDNPEIVTLVHCHGCGQFSVIGDCTENLPTPTKQLHCPRCGTKITAEQVFDYVDIQVVDYDQR